MFRLGILRVSSLFLERWPRFGSALNPLWFRFGSVLLRPTVTCVYVCVT